MVMIFKDFFVAWVLYDRLRTSNPKKSRDASGTDGDSHDKRPKESTP
jgi:hypothetical protein